MIVESYFTTTAAWAPVLSCLYFVRLHHTRTVIIQPLDVHILSEAFTQEMDFLSAYLLCQGVRLQLSVYK